MMRVGSRWRSFMVVLFAVKDSVFAEPSGREQLFFVPVVVVPGKTFDFKVL